MRCKLPILVYHSIDERETSISTRREHFLNQMRRFSQKGWKTLTLGEAAARVKRGENLEKNRFCITFDDGMKSVRDEADPILREFGFRATLFVITNQVGARPNWYRLPEAYRGEPLLPIDELAKLKDAGWDLQPHTHDHPVLPHLPLDLQIEQIGRSRELMLKWFGSEGESAGSVLAYPFGQFDENTKKAMQTAGMRAGVTLRFSTWVEREEMFTWPRIGSAWLKNSGLRQSLATAGVLERYVNLKGKIRGDRRRHFLEPDEETTRGLLRGGPSEAGKHDA